MVRKLVSHLAIHVLPQAQSEPKFGLPHEPYRESGGVRWHDGYGLVLRNCFLDPLSKICDIN